MCSPFWCVWGVVRGVFPGGGVSTTHLLRGWHRSRAAVVLLQWGCELFTVLQRTGPKPALIAMTFESWGLGDTKITEWQISSRIWQKGHFSLICGFLFGCNSLTLCSSYGKWCCISYLGVEEANGKGNVCWTYRKVERLCLYNGRNNFISMNSLSFYSNFYG